MKLQLSIWATVRKQLLLDILGMKFKYLEEKTAVIFENKFEIFQDCDSSSRGKQNESSLSAFMCQMNDVNDLNLQA